MIGSVTASAKAHTAASAAVKRHPVKLDAELATARAQLTDWVTCPSRTTPEGKAKIETYSSKVDNIKAQMKIAEKAPPDTADAPPTGGSVSPVLGSRLDVYV